MLAEAFNRTMSGMAAASEAAANAQAILVDQFGFPGGETAGDVCDASGQLTLLADNSARQHLIVRTLVNGFTHLCPGVSVTIRSALLSDPLDDVASNVEQIETAVAASGADLLFLPHLDLPTLAERGVIAPVMGNAAEPDLLDPALMQQMRPITVLAMRSGNQSYGVPVIIDLQVLYHNRDLVADPAGTLADLAPRRKTARRWCWMAALPGASGASARSAASFSGPDGQFALSPLALTRAGWPGCRNRANVSAFAARPRAAKCANCS